MSEYFELPDDLFLVRVAGDEESDAGMTLSFSRAPTVLLNFAANRFTRHSARLYKDRFGIGAMDWRMMVMLTREPGCSAAHASKTIGIDKGAVSRSLARLQASGLAEGACNTPDERRRDWRLTSRGRVLHDQILTLALKRQKRLLAGFSPQDVNAFNGYLRRFLDNLHDLQEEGRDNQDRESAFKAL